ncbi:hypothetical protein [Nannocystis sp.]|nr:hypothetical protein [Nannocystis sp.]MBK7827270.1 hypothetical protein [Nannocystis sp.]
MSWVLHEVPPFFLVGIAAPMQPSRSAHSSKVCGALMKAPPLPPPV